MFVKSLPVLVLCLAIAATASVHPGHVQATPANVTTADDKALEQQSSNTTQCQGTHEAQNATSPQHPEPLSWKTVPDCTTYANPVLDTYNNTWAYDVVFNRSCAVRGSHAVKQVPAFDAAPACEHVPNTNNSSPDSYGHLWGWQNNASCAFKDANGKAITIIPVRVYHVSRNHGRKLQQAVAQASASATADATKSNNAAAVANSDAKAAANGPNSSSTSIATSNAAATNGTAIARSRADSSAEQNSTSLAIAATNSTATQGGVAISDKSASAHAAANSSAFDIQVGTASDATVTWETAPVCPAAPTASNSIKDASGRLWGATSDGRSCAFKYSDGKPVYYTAGSFTAQTAGVSVSWQAAPACKLQPPTNARIDTLGRLWGWENGASCKYVDAAGNAVMVASSPPAAATSSASASAAANANAATASSPSPSATSAGVPSDSLSPSPVPSPSPSPLSPEPTPAHGSSYAFASASAFATSTGGNGSATASASATAAAISKSRKAARRSLVL